MIIDAVSPLLVAMPGPASAPIDGAGVFAPVAVALDVLVALAVLILLVARHARRPVVRHQVSVFVRRRRAAAALALLALGATAAHAGDVTDHLQCFKVTDAARRHLKGVVDSIDVVIGKAHRDEDTILAQNALSVLRWPSNVPADAVKVVVQHGWISRGPPPAL